MDAKRLTSLRLFYYHMVSVEGRVFKLTGSLVCDLGEAHSYLHKHTLIGWMARNTDM